MLIWMITKNPKPDLNSDLNDIINPLGHFSPIGIDFKPTKNNPRYTTSPSTPKISKAITSLSECYQSADLQPKIYIRSKNPGLLAPLLNLPQRGAALTSIKALLVENRPWNHCVRDNHKYSCIAPYD
jgi:hypothetical protein